MLVVKGAPTNNINFIPCLRFETSYIFVDTMVTHRNGRNIDR